ncbi:MAG: hydroxylamine oxidoreductase, partial [candidate division Zixibacteria bacterium]|nr:hydroxylamine oxidoreductase [candidate division Zixibacteria bacterium]
MKRINLVMLITALLLFGFVVTNASRTVPTSMSKESAACVTCHEADMPGLVKEWRHSQHFAADVGCYECHAADKDDADAVEHDDYLI